MTALATTEATLRRALDQLSFAVVLIAADGRTLFANAAARALLHGGDGPWVSDGRISAGAPLGLAPLGAVWDAGSPAPVTLTVPTPGGGRPLLLFAVPLTPAGPDGRHGDGVAAMAVVVDPSPPDPTVAGDPEPRFGMTRAEWNVARRLGDGSTLEEVAHAAGVSQNTVRTQLKKVFRKLGVHRQADLVRLVTLASVLRGG